MKATFDQKFIESQKVTLLKLRSDIMNHMRTSEIENIHADRDEVVEDVDQSQLLMGQSVSMGLRDHELHNLHEIEEALYRIEAGTYGICEETEEYISQRRLEKIPWTRLSIGAQEELEKSQSGSMLAA